MTWLQCSTALTMLPSLMLRASRRAMPNLALATKVQTSSFKMNLSTTSVLLNDDSRRLPSMPALTGFHVPMTPGFVHTIRNWFIMRFLVQPYFDQEFSKEVWLFFTEPKNKLLFQYFQDFVDGALEAVLVVSNALSRGDMEPLADTVCPECLSMVKEGLSLFTPEQKRALNFSREDIHLHFIYQVRLFL